MTHRLDNVSICNYKSCEEANIPLSGFTPLVGYNNAGKSNILSAIRWLLRRTSLTASDFYNPEEPVIVEGVISGITDDLLGNLEEKHKNSIEPYLSDQALKLRRIQNAPADSVKKIVLEVFDSSGDGEWKSNPAGIDNAISALFPEPITVGAMEDAEEDVTKAKTSTTIGKLIAEVLSPIEEQHGAAIHEALDGLRKKLGADGTERAPEITALDNAANEKLAEFFPGVKIRMHVPTPEIKEVLKGGTIRIYEGDDETGKEMTVLGHGAQRSIQMALIRHLADIKRAEDAAVSTTLLLIDEPELYLHPQGVEQVRVALKRLSNEGYQVVFSTHSPQMIVSDDIRSTLLIRKTTENGTHARRRLEEAVSAVITDAPSQVEMLFSLQNSSQFLFSEKVVLTEGATEHRLLPLIFEKIRGSTMGQEKIALISQGGVLNTRKTLSVLNAMDLPTKAIVDLDYAFRGASKDGFIGQEDENIDVCKGIMGTLAEQHDIKLADDGFPQKKGSSMSPSDAFSLMASDAAAKDAINNLHEQLKEQGIWLWANGSIEKHLGIEGKGEQVWSAFSGRLENESVEDAIDDHDGFVALIEWLTHE